MFKSLLKASLVIGAAAAALSLQASAQTVQLQVVGSSAFFLEAGLGANFSSGPINAPCVWSATSGVSATDSTVSPAALDSGSAWVAWTKGTGGTCASPASDALIYGYLNTDSVVGNRCLFNGCALSYPTSTPSPAGLILSGGVTNCGTTGECTLPNAVAIKLNAKVTNVAATDIRPEDAEFAIARALQAPCGAQIGSTQYYALGYSNGGVINSAIPGSTKKFNVVSFKLPSTAPNVTLVGATAILVAVHSDGTSTGFATHADISSASLARLLDGSTITTPAGGAANVLVREPLSGTYNTMEYNVPNTTANKTSQDVGQTQPAADQNCMLSGGVEVANPTLKFTDATTGATRLRAIGTGEELAQVGSYANVSGGTNNLGYGFWSVANFAGLGGVSHTGYLTVDGVDPLNNTSASCAYTGAIPTNGTTALQCVDMHNVANGTYPIYSLLRMVNTDTTISSTVGSLASAAQLFVTFNSPTARPDFIRPTSMTTVREHFTPPLAISGSTYPATNTNGDKQFTARTNCTALPEAGGDVGGVVVPLVTGTNNDSSWCLANSNPNGQTGARR